MSTASILEVFAAMATALGGYEGVKWLVNFLVHRKQEKRLKESEANQSEVATENAMRDMYEDTLSKMRELDEQRINEIREDYKARIAELNKVNAELHETNNALHRQNMELLKEGARKDEIIFDKTAKIRELSELRVVDARKIGELEGDVQYLECWKCYREFGEGKNDCKRREPEQNPPIKFKPRKHDQLTNTNRERSDR